MITTAHCFFEQTGTFKSVFKKIGINVYDYDIEDNFRETDFKIDLFSEIEKAYDNKDSIFDDFSDNDLIFAFFPCIRFCANNKMFFLGNAIQQKNWRDDEKIEYAMKLEFQRSNLFQIFSKFYLVCMNRKIKTIIENPFTQPHYLTEYFPIKPALIDKDRSIHMDKFKKPTQYFLSTLNLKIIT